MALTDKQKMKIVTLLGWPVKTLISSSTHYNTMIVARLENLSHEAEVLVRENLSSIEDIDKRLGTSIGKAGLKRIGDIEFDGRGGVFSDLKKERNRLFKELSDLLDIAYVKSGGVNIGVCV